MKRWLVGALAGLALSCGANEKPRDAVPRAMTNPGPQPFRWQASAFRPMRVTPLRYKGEPTPCVTDKIERPCDIELTAARELYYRRYTSIVAGRIGPALAIRRPDTSETVFSLEPDGTLAGHGIFQRPESAQVLFCRLTDEPKLHCEHRFDAKILPRIWNQENCKASFILSVDGGAMKVTFPAFPKEPPATAARIDPPPPDDAGKGLALFLYAMEAINGDIAMHTPYVDHMNKK